MSQLLLDRLKSQGLVGHASARRAHHSREILQYWRRDYGDERMPIRHIVQYQPIPILVRQSAIDELEEIWVRQQHQRMIRLVLPKIRKQRVFIDLLTLFELKEQVQLL